MAAGALLAAVVAAAAAAAALAPSSTMRALLLWAKARWAARKANVAAGKAAGKAWTTLAVGAGVAVGLRAAGKHMGANIVAVRVVVDMSCAAAGDGVQAGALGSCKVAGEAASTRHVGGGG